MSTFTQIELERLPAPEVIDVPQFELLLGEMIEAVIAVAPELGPALSVESEPMRIVLRVCAYYRMLDRLAFNDDARGLLLGKAVGTDLDNLAAFWGVERLTVTPADPEAVPPVEAVLETDTSLRRRTQLSLEGHSTAGPIGSYLFLALSASGKVKDASVLPHTPGPGDVTVRLLAHEGDGAPDVATLEAVNAALSAEEHRPCNDTVIVSSASIVPYRIEARLTLYHGPDDASVLATVRERLVEYAADHHRIGHDITLSGLYAAMHLPGAVQRVELISPAADIVIDDTQAAWLSEPAIVTIGGRDV